MLKLTPGANKANAILNRIVLFLIGGIAIITGMCLFSGDMWMLTPRAEQYQPATGDLVDVVIYEPSKFFFALANSTPKCNTRQIKQPVVVHQTRSAV
ncbi:hypothetical protein RZP17_21355, partial [Klebsiella variicola subsp. variicola]|nr:hypothetical protein [Klebsiella variicola subsp. variicola]